MMQRIAPVVLLAAFLGAAGCNQQKLNVERDVTVSGGDIRQVTPEGPKAEKVRVQVTATEPVNIDVVLDSRAGEIMNKLQADKRPTTGEVLGSKEKAKNDVLDVTVPGGQPFSVLVSGATKKSDVKLKITSQ